MKNFDAKFKNIFNHLKSEIEVTPDLALVLGSGLGDFAESVEILKSVPTSDIPGYPHSTVQGHKGFIHFGKYRNKKIILFQGRLHLYEGYRLSESLLPVLIANEFGCKKIILTNAAGGINKIFNPGDLMLNVSFNSINIKKELAELMGVAAVNQKNRILNFPSPEINEVIRKSALEEQINLREGVYWFVKGPSYETPAEIKMIGLSGGDAVGMSTVHEAIFAASIGMEVSAVSLITNYAAGISSTKLSHDEVIETANEAKSKFEKLIKKTIELI